MKVYGNNNVKVYYNLDKSLPSTLASSIANSNLKEEFNIVSPEIIESLKQLILNGAGGLKCPRCGAPLDTRIARMYDLEDNLVLHPKAHCTKCPFQIHS